MNRNDADMDRVLRIEESFIQPDHVDWDHIAVNDSMTHSADRSSDIGRILLAEVLSSQSDPLIVIHDLTVLPVDDGTH